MRLTMVLLTPPGMAHKESTLSRQQALALGMLPTEAGVCLRRHVARKTFRPGSVQA